MSRQAKLLRIGRGALYYLPRPVSPADIADYFGWYNAQRPHSKLDKMTPDRAYLDKLPK